MHNILSLEIISKQIKEKFLFNLGSHFLTSRFDFDNGTSLWHRSRHPLVGIETFDETRFDDNSVANSDRLSINFPTNKIENRDLCEPYSIFFILLSAILQRKKKEYDSIYFTTERLVNNF